MNLVSIPANPVPDEVVTGMLKTPDGVELRFARWAPPPGRKGTVCIFQGRAEFIEKYFETVRDLRARGFAVATLDWRGQGGSQRALVRSAQGPCRRLRRLRDRSRNLHAARSCCRIVRRRISRSAIRWARRVLLRIAHKGSRWFDRMVLSAPMIGLSGAGAIRGSRGRRCRSCACVGMGSAYVPGGDATRDGDAVPSSATR